VTPVTDRRAGPGYSCPAFKKTLASGGRKPAQKSGGMVLGPGHRLLGARYFLCSGYAWILLLCARVSGPVRLRN